MEKNIGATELRQRLTDVLQAVRDERETYVVETFGRPQAVLVNIDLYERFKQLRSEREAFFQWLDDTSTRNAEYNLSLTREEILTIIAQAREEVALDGANSGVE